MYERAAALRLEAIESLLWDAEEGAWFDYSLVTHSRHLAFYASNLAPLWAQCYSQPEMAEKAVQYLKVGGEGRKKTHALNMHMKFHLLLAAPGRCKL